MQQKIDPPKVFISYCWTSDQHKAWVRRLAEELISQYVDVILDIWHLREGQDTHAFMEQMVSDVDIKKVIMVCDNRYTERANSRSGGVGTETQIITTEVYKSHIQTKFVAIVTERDEDGVPLIPAYYGSKKYIDFSDPISQAEPMQQLLRWIFDKPLDVPPPLGKPPAFVNETDKSPIMNTSVPSRRAVESIRTERTNAVSVTRDYLDILASEFEAFRLKNKATEAFLDNIKAFLPYRNEAIDVFSAIASSEQSDLFIPVLHRFLEKIIVYIDRPEHMNSWSSNDFDNFKFLVHEIFLYLLAVFIRYERYTAFTYLIQEDFFVGEVIARNGDIMKPFTIFRQYVPSLHTDVRDSLAHGRLLSVRNTGTSITFQHVITADIILTVRSAATLRDARPWYPVTAAMMNPYHRFLEIFARAKSLRSFGKIKSMLGVDSVDELKEIALNLDSREGFIIGDAFDNTSISSLVCASKLGTSN